MYVYRLSVQGWAGEMSPVATLIFLGALNGHFFNIYITDILLLFLLLLLINTGHNFQRED